ncbi:hemin uptake protein HemP [Paracoccus aerodenitrificans]|uniref:hemin uptake protein HemP n=1 Tax=Paracoccus aerodenitrificans TaxID=3017781 RepID=UPI0022F0F2E4|nr:hemin uptake protein HemP [Paracoccus aerodenitrificans]WBU62965.1 hemin uptake protein HemP [Paracoccus aerodenitrificans]
MTATRPAEFGRVGATPVNNLPVHEAEALTQGGNQALIVLNDQVYNLRITRAGKLILTK